MWGGYAVVVRGDVPPLRWWWKMAFAVNLCRSPSVAVKDGFCNEALSFPITQLRKKDWERGSERRKRVVGAMLGYEHFVYPYQSTGPVLRIMKTRWALDDKKFRALKLGSVPRVPKCPWPEVRLKNSPCHVKKVENQTIQCNCIAIGPVKVSLRWFNSLIIVLKT